VERLFAWYRIGSSAGAVVALVTANLVPLAGVLWFGWSVWTILIVYWLENGIVGLFNVLKMAVVAGAGKLAVIPFFIVHYGMFWFVHGVFVLTLPTFTGLGASDGLAQPMPLFPSEGGLGSVNLDSRPIGPDGTSIVVAGIGLFLSHGLSYVLNFVRGGEYRRVTATQLMFAPYRRVVTLHLTIILGALAVAAFGATLVPLLILIGIKTAIDLGLHLREHREPAI
jgi:hypothetical protein